MVLGSNLIIITKFSWAISRVKWLNSEKKTTFRRPYLSSSSVCWYGYGWEKQVCPVYTCPGPSSRLFFPTISISAPWGRGQKWSTTLPGWQLERTSVYSVARKAAHLTTSLLVVSHTRGVTIVTRYCIPAPDIYFCKNYKQVHTQRCHLQFPAPHVKIGPYVCTAVIIGAAETDEPSFRPYFRLESQNRQW